MTGQRVSIRADEKASARRRERTLWRLRRIGVAERETDLEVATGIRRALCIMSNIDDRVRGESKARSNEGAAGRDDALRKRVD